MSLGNDTGVESLNMKKINIIVIISMVFMFTPFSGGFAGDGKQGKTPVRPGQNEPAKTGQGGNKSTAECQTKPELCPGGKMGKLTVCPGEDPKLKCPNN